MARVRPRNDPEISLFPFLSILVSLIGALVLLIVVLSMLQGMLGDGRSIEEFARARAAQELRQQMAELEEEMESFRVELEAAEQTAGRLEAMRERFAVLRKRLETLRDDAATAQQRHDALQRELENLQFQLADLDREEPKLEQAIAQLTAELERRQANLEAEPTLVVQPAGAGFMGEGQPLFFVECSARGITVHRGEDEEPLRVTSDSIGADADYDQFLHEVTSIPDSMIIFLLRPDGLNAYNRAAGWAESQFEARHGRLPLPGQGEVDLSHFLN